MRKAIFIALLSIIVVSFGYAQNPQNNEFQMFESQISENSSFEDIKNVVSLAQKTFQKNAKNLNKKQTEYANSLFELAGVRKKAFAVLKTKLFYEKGASEEKLKYLNFYHQNGAALLANLEEAVKIYENSGVENLQRVQASFELGWLYENYSPPEKKPQTLSDKNETIKKIQTLYQNVYDLREKILGKTDEATLVTKYYLADSYLKGSSFEKALPLYESFISLTVQKFGRKFEPLLPALRTYRSILWMLGRFQEMPKIEEHISEITGENKELPISLLNISLRAKNLNYEGLRDLEGNVNININPEVWYYSTNRVATPDQNSEVRTPPKVKLLGAGNAPSRIGIVKAIVVRVEIDEYGKVVEAKAENTDEKKAKKIEEIVMKWEFVPFKFEGTARKMNGFVYYTEEKSAVL
jgi:hypothetical protein